MLINECKPEFQFKKSSKNAKFGQCLYLVAHLCYEQNRCAERTVTFNNFCREVGQLSGQQHANIITLFQFNSRILVEDFVVETSNSCMSLVFH